MAYVAASSAPGSSGGVGSEASGGAGNGLGVHALLLYAADLSGRLLARLLEGSTHLAQFLQLGLARQAVRQRPQAA